MKKFLYFLFLVFVVGYFFWQKEVLVSRVNYLLQGPCDIPIDYHLGTLDEDYQLSEKDFLVRTEKATNIWEKAVGKNLFAYDPQAGLVVNLIYTERQAVLDKLEQLQGKISAGKGSLESMAAEYRSLAQAFRARLETFNREVALWNDRGGAPQEIYEQLMREQEELKAEAEKLNSLARKLNLSVETYNVQVGEFNQNVKVFNQATREKPEAGLYDGSVPKIDIYLTASDQELIHTLAHEFGHAVGLEHQDDPQAIMYLFSSELSQPTEAEQQALQAICEERNWQKQLRSLQEKLQKEF